MLYNKLIHSVGFDAIASALNVNIDQGLKDQDEADSRTKDFGSNFRAELVPKPCFEFLKEQLGDPMLIILICAAVVSLVLNFATASTEDYATGKCLCHGKQPFNY